MAKSIHYWRKYAMYGILDTSIQVMEVFDTSA